MAFGVVLVVFIIVIFGTRQKRETTLANREKTKQKPIQFVNDSLVVVSLHARIWPRHHDIPCGGDRGGDDGRDRGAEEAVQ